MRRIAVVEFKTKCLAYLSKLQKTGGDLVITKRGKPLAKVTPIRDTKGPSLANSIEHQDDIVSPVESAWEADQP